MLLLPSVPTFAKKSKRFINIFTQAGATWTTFMKSVAPRFTRETGIGVTFTEVPYPSMYEATQLGLISAEHSPYDVVMMAEWIVTFASLGRLVPVDSVMTSKDKAGLYPASVHKCTYRGHVYGFPLSQSTEALYVRTDLMKKAGVREPTVAKPWTWEEFLEAAKKMTKHPVYGYALKAARYTISAYQFQDLSYQAGIGVNGITDAGNKVVLRSPRGFEAMRFYNGLRTAGVMPQGVLNFEETEIQTLFLQGSLAIAQNWNYMYSLAQTPSQSKVVGKFIAAPLPYKVRQGVLIGGWQSTVPVSAQHQEEAMRWIRWISTPEMNLEMTLHYDPEPAWFSVLENPEVKSKLPYLAGVWNHMYKVGYAPLRAQQYNSVMLLMAGVQQEVLTGAVTPVQAIDLEANEISGIIGT